MNVATYENLRTLAAAVRTQIDSSIEQSKQYADAVLVKSSSDWEEYDTANPSYIKNKPFYDTYDISSEFVEGLQINKYNQQLNNYYTGIYWDSGWMSLPNSFKLGDALLLRYGDIAVTIILKQNEHLANTLYDGNLLYSDATVGINNGEKYLLTIADSMVRLIVVDYKEDAELSFDLYILTPKFKQIEEKFIPSTIARISDIHDATDPEAISNSELDEILIL